MKQIIVGTYLAGPDQYQLVLREGTGGEFYNVPEIGSVPRIKVGGDCKTWQETLSILLHEVIELTLDRLRVRLAITNTCASDNNAYIFVFTHEHFSEACARTAEFCALAIPDLAAKWKAYCKARDNK